MGNQAKVGRPAADVATQDDISPADLVPRVAAALSSPCINGCLRLLEEHHLPNTRRIGGLRGEIPRDFVEGCGNSKNDLAFVEIPHATLCAFRVEEPFFDMLEIQPRTLEWGKLLNIGFPWQDRFLRIDVEVR